MKKITSLILAVICAISMLSSMVLAGEPVASPEKAAYEELKASGEYISVGTLNSNDGDENFSYFMVRTGGEIVNNDPVHPYYYVTVGHPISSGVIKYNNQTKEKT